MRAGRGQFARVAVIAVCLAVGAGPALQAQGRGGGGPGGGGPGGRRNGWAAVSFPAAGREAAGREWAGRGRLEGLRRSNAGRGRRAVRGCSLGLRDVGGTTGPPSRA